MELNTREKQRVADYLAMIHVTGTTVRGMHLKSRWSSDVLLGYRYDESRNDGGIWSLRPDTMELVKDHPLVRTVEAMIADGYRVDHRAIRRGKRWTISDGVPMRHIEDDRKARVDLNGNARQSDGPDGRWAAKDLGNPGVAPGGLGPNAHTQTA